MARRTVHLDCSAVGEAEMGLVDALARLQLELRRLGLELRLDSPAPSLRELIQLAGLDPVLGVEAGRQAEEREEPLRVKEEGQLTDPTA